MIPITTVGIVFGTYSPACPTVDTPLAWSLEAKLGVPEHRLCGFLAGQMADGSYHVYAATGPLTITAVPEPATWAMLGLGFAALGFAGYRKTCTPRAVTF